MRISRGLIAVLATLGLILLAFTPASSATGSGVSDKPGQKCNRTNDSVRKLLECVTLDGVMEHEYAFADIAAANGGTRSAGTPGYDASVDYVEQRMEAAGYVVTRQEFDVYSFEDQGGSELEQTAPTPTSYVLGTDFAATPHSEPGDVTAGVTAVDIALGLGNTSTSGCQDSDFATFPAGDIALIQRGDCTFEIKAENAAEAGAVGVLFFNQGNTTDASRNGIPAVTLGNDYTGGLPALSTTYARGAEFAGIDGLEMRLFADVTRTPAKTENVIAESRTGDPTNVVMAGAHLDSVPEGAGINDNGSGSAALLETAEQLAKATREFPNKVRFAWWGAEEAGLVGSNYYVNNLGTEGRSAIEMYLNFDMVGSPNYGLFIYDGDGSGFGMVGPDGSDEIEALFERYYAERGIPSEPTAFTARSDYQAFILNGIPAGGLFTGAEGVKTAAQAAKWGGTAGVAYDPCYHSECDGIDNLSHEALDINSDAMAYVVFLYASGQEAINAG
ncbi:Zn-dependent M28 family amino/carboxypeptidase [Nocardioides thalensis]|uniref:Zn-dependent M28 family amino/carboxypeptidase n=1 Tax=Nocardioides thalensis TaxID=1914755 RepID=A0A853CBA3_9ACTN|nr:M28 family metallopeptidase [Nocardioides thalensis]NYJ03688.1 Zn-dependent M28 family amino/carboxypeptidase [Nocardioides thalensis]